MKKLLLYAFLLPTLIQPQQKKLRLLYDLAQDYGDFFQQDEHDNGFWKKFKKALHKKGYSAQAAKYSLQSLQDSYDADCVIFFNLPMSLTHGNEASRLAAPVVEAIDTLTFRPSNLIAFNLF